MLKGVVITLLTLYRYKNVLYYYMCQRQYQYGVRQRIQVGSESTIYVPLAKVHLKFAYAVWRELQNHVLSNKGRGYDRRNWFIKYYTKWDKGKLSINFQLLDQDIRTIAHQITDEEFLSTQYKKFRQEFILQKHSKDKTTLEVILNCMAILELANNFPLFSQFVHDLKRLARSQQCDTQSKCNWVYKYVNCLSYHHNLKYRKNIFPQVGLLKKILEADCKIVYANKKYERCRLELPVMQELIECLICAEVYGIRYKQFRCTLLSKRIGESMYLEASDIYYIQVNREYTSNYLLKVLRFNYSFGHNYESSKYPDWISVDVRHDLLILELKPTIHDCGTYYMQMFGEDNLILLEVEIEVKSHLNQPK